LISDILRLRELNKRIGFNNFKGLTLKFAFSFFPPCSAHSAPSSESFLTIPILKNVKDLRASEIRNCVNQKAEETHGADDAALAMNLDPAKQLKKHAHGRGAVTKEMKRVRRLLTWEKPLTAYVVPATNRLSPEENRA
jgi:hypothetical protein